MPKTYPCIAGQLGICNWQGWTSKLKPVLLSAHYELPSHVHSENMLVEQSTHSALHFAPGTCINIQVYVRYQPKCLGLSRECTEWCDDVTGGRSPVAGFKCFVRVVLGTLSQRCFRSTKRQGGNGKVRFWFFQIICIILNQVLIRLCFFLKCNAKLSNAYILWKWFIRSVSVSLHGVCLFFFIDKACVSKCPCSRMKVMCVDIV